VSRAYVENSAALQTTFSTDNGVVTLLDVMPTGDERVDVVRRLTGVKGTVRMHHEWVVRFDYGTARPWIRRRLEDSEHRRSPPWPVPTSSSCGVSGCRWPPATVTSTTSTSTRETS
jgi:hypothetical protein